MLFRVLFAFVLTIVLRTSLAHGQTSDERALAEDKFRQGRELMQAGDYTEALPLFEASHKMVPGHGKLLNMAVCQQELGRLHTAYELFDELSRALPESDERRSLVFESIAALRPRIPHLRLEIPSELASIVRVSIDGKPVRNEALGFLIGVDPGKHVVLAVYPNGSEAFQVVDVQERHVVPVKLAPPTPFIIKKPEQEEVKPPVHTEMPPAALPTNIFQTYPAKYSTTKRGPSVGVSVLLGAGALAGLGAGIGLGMHAVSLYEQSASHCDRVSMTTYCTPEGLELRGTSRSYLYLSDLTLGVGLGFTGGLVAYLLNGRSTAAASTGFDATIAFSRAGAFFQGRW